MWITTFKRILKTGLVNFWRDKFVSLSSIVVMVITILVFLSLIFMRQMFASALTALENKVDVNVYFVPTADEGEIMPIVTALKALPEIKEVTYISREEALAQFKTRHENDSITLQALDELGDNPLGAIVNIQAIDPSQYESIANFLDQESLLTSSDSTSIVERINYNQNKTAIDKLNSLINSSRKIGMIVAIVLVVMSILITLNTIRLAIYMSREEIGVMRLVGASAFYVRGPFVVAGMVYGLIAGILALIICYPVVLWFGKESINLFIGFNAYQYYLEHIWMLAGIGIGSGVIVGAISSFLAVQKYLRK